MHQSFLTYANGRHAFVALGLVCGALIAYFAHEPLGGPNGGTWLGYTLGTIAAVLVVYLSWYGFRRRSFRAGPGSASGWLSAHVYLGLATLVLVLLHSGFHFGWNVHTAAAVLLALVVLSGCWGVYAYVRYPALMLRIRGHTSRESLLERLAELDRRAQALSAGLGDGLSRLVSEAIRRTQLGGGAWQQLRGRDRSAILVGAGEADPHHDQVVSNEGQHVLIEHLARAHSRTSDSVNVSRLQGLLEIAGEKAVIVGRIQKDVQLQALLQIWLYVHLPLCFGLLAALLAHLIAVFVYW
ncbi:MAG: hypothetical protein U1F35_07795 [Steroidobacteraceae bacterium]